MSEKNYVIGVDYGSDSVRSVIVNAENGKQIASAVHEYTRWKSGEFCVPSQNQFRQHPLDYIEGLEKTIKESLTNAQDVKTFEIKGISIDTTGSTVVAVDKSGTPLSLKPEFAGNPNAMFVLWKDHTAVKEAQQINDLARSWGGEDYTKYEGGIYSSEWFWAKLLHVLREDEAVRENAFSWVEHCDWMPALLTGNLDPLTLKRSRCAAGHKAMWHESFDGLPPEEFLVKLDPLLEGLRSKLYRETYTCDVKAGELTSEWADRLGLNEGIAVGVGAFDAHLGAAGAEIRPHVLTKVMGTSTCDMLVVPNQEMGDKLISGICGQVDGSILPGMVGMEAGQSAFGDVYSWFRSLLSWPLKNALLNKSADLDEKTVDTLIDKMIPELTAQAENILIGESGIVAQDWFNGRRSPDANPLLKGAITGLGLGSDAPHIFRALVEATAFGSKTIMERFESQGVEVKEVLALGGVAKKSSFVMQIMADVLNRDIEVVQCDQACALGAAMYAATVADIYTDVFEAQKAMGNGVDEKYSPIPENAKAYDSLYKQYCRTGAFLEQESFVNP